MFFHLLTNFICPFCFLGVFEDQNGMFFCLLPLYILLTFLEVLKPWAECFFVCLVFVAVPT